MDGGGWSCKLIRVPGSLGKYGWVRCKTASHRSATALEPTLVQNNRWFHHLLTDGINVEYRTSEGDARGDKAWLVDSANPARNDVLAVSQFTVKCRNSRDNRAEGPVGRTGRYWESLLALEDRSNCARKCREFLRI
jgi:hypothetical protein